MLDKIAIFAEVARSQINHTMAHERPETETNQEKEIDLLELLRAVWAARRRIVLYAAVGAAVGLIVGFSIPKTYVTTIKLAPESKTAGNGGGGMAGLAAMAGFNLNAGAGTEGITTAIFPEIVQSTPFLLEFAEIPITLMPRKTGEPGERMTLFEYVSDHQRQAWWKYLAAAPGRAVGWLLGRDREEEPVPPVDSVELLHLPKAYKDFVKALNRMMMVEEDKKSSLLEAKVTMQDPFVAAVVADSLVAKLQKYMTVYRTQKTRHDLEQNMRQNAEAQARYYEVENRLAEAIDQNRNISSESLRVRIERLRNERTLAYSIWNQTAMQVETAKIKLQEEMPIATVVEPAIISDRPAAPKKMVILIAFAFLGGLWAAGGVVVRFLLAEGATSSAEVASRG